MYVFISLFCSYHPCWYIMVTMGLAKWDSLECNSVSCIYTLSCCSARGNTYAIMCTYVGVGTMPSSPFTLESEN